MKATPSKTELKAEVMKKLESEGDLATDHERMQYQCSIVTFDPHACRLEVGWLSQEQNELSTA